MRESLASGEQREWERTCPLDITSDVLWKLDAYRAALYLLHVWRGDRKALLAAPGGDHVAGQLTKATGSICANLAEGYSRSTRADRLRFLDYALGSTRECVTWYQAATDILADEQLASRLHLLTRIRSLLLGLIRSLRVGPSPLARFRP